MTESMQESEGKGRGRSNSLKSHVVDYLKVWIMSPEHISHPYPTEKEKVQIISDTGIELKKLNNWFVNNRIRYWKPRMEALEKRQHKHRHEEQGEHQAATVTTEQTQVETVSPEFRNALGYNVREALKRALMETMETTQHFSLQSQTSIHAISEPSTSGSASVISSSDGDVSDEGSVEPVQKNLKTSFLRSESLLEPVQKNLKTSFLRVESLLDVTQTLTTFKRKREEDAPQTPRRKYSRKDINLWRVVCKTSPRVNDEGLPTFDEAALLFGYSSDN
jgi:hypothetical protein